MHQRPSPRLPPSVTPTLWPLLALRLQWQPPLDAAGLAQLIFKHQKELSAMNKKNGVPRPRSAPKPAGQKYCYIHGYQKSHTGAECNVLKANAQQQYTPQHLAATDHHHLAGGNPNARG